MDRNKILALKYRPQEFGDLIGQEVMARTITNAIKIGKTPNAYLLTGIRGVGKTTTARLIAKALNCEKNTSKVKCSKESPCSICKEISNSNNIDVLEMDAASKTGIDDVRELIENSKYSPSVAKYKIFIIDEVHMLSKQAFNGLLKTLEEPPPSLKFVLATTEVRKIPVTIISRCQRFDLKRVSLKEIFDHLKKIATSEKGKISDEAIKIISQVSEGSVRDAISLLDRSLIFQGINQKDQIEDSDVREMLGLADKGEIISLLNEIFKANKKNAFNKITQLINKGIDPKNFLNDILDILNLVSRQISLGNIENDKLLPESQIKSIFEMSKNLEIEDIGLFWQFTLKTLDDLKIIGDENIALEMYVLQLIHLKEIKPSQDNTGNLNENINGRVDGPNEKSINDLIDNSKTKIKSQLKNTDQVKTKSVSEPINESSYGKLKINTYKDLVDLANKENEIELKYDLERNVNLVSFRNGKIDISFNEKLNKNFTKNLTTKLMQWTGERWIISLSQNDGEKTLYQKKSEEKIDKINKALEMKEVKSLLNQFDDAKLVDIEKDEA